MPVRALLEAEDARLDVWRVWVDGCRVAMLAKWCTVVQDVVFQKKKDTKASQFALDLYGTTEGSFV